MKIKNFKLSKKAMSLLVAGGISLAPIHGLGVTDNSYNPGTFVKMVEQDDSLDYGEYIVKEGDNLSRISEKICSHLRIESSTKYWPVLAFLNHYPRVIKEGDIIIFPKSSNRLIELNNQLQQSGWTSKYKQMNKVYGTKQPKKKISMEAVGDILYNIYGDEVCIDEDFIRLYLKVSGLDNKYELTSNEKMDNDTYVDLTEWVPTIDELYDYEERNKPKTK